MNCREIQVLLSTRGDLPMRDERLVQEHLAGCHHCSSAWREAQRTTAMLQALPQASGHPPARVVAAVARLVRDEPRAPVSVNFRFVSGLAILAVLLLAFFLRPAPPSDISPTAGGQIPFQAQPATGAVTVDPFKQVLVVASVPTGGLLDEATITVYDPQRQAELYSSPGDDVAISPDGRLYVASLTSVAALDGATGAELWRAAIDDRIQHPSWNGPSALGLSPDGRWLFVVSDDRDGRVPPWLQVIDARDGTLQMERIPLPDGCHVPRLVSPYTGPSLYIVCPESIHRLDAETRWIEAVLHLGDLEHGPTGVLQDAIVEPDGERYLAAIMGATDVDNPLWLVFFDLQRGNWDSYSSIPYHAKLPPGVTIRSAALSSSGDYSRLGVLLFVRDEQGQDIGGQVLLVDPAGSGRTVPIDQAGASGPLGRAGLALDYDGSRVYIVSSAGGQEVLLELSSTEQAPRRALQSDWLEGRRVIRLLGGLPGVDRRRAAMPTPPPAPIGGEVVTDTFQLVSTPPCGTAEPQPSPTLPPTPAGRPNGALHATPTLTPVLPTLAGVPNGAPHATPTPTPVLPTPAGAPNDVLQTTPTFPPPPTQAPPETGLASPTPTAAGQHSPRDPGWGGSAATPSPVPLPASPC